MGEVDPDGGGPPDQDGDPGTGLSLGDDVVTKPVQQRGRLHGLGACRRVQVGDGDPAGWAEDRWRDRDHTWLVRHFVKEGDEGRFVRWRGQLGDQLERAAEARSEPFGQQVVGGQGRAARGSLPASSRPRLREISAARS